MRLSVAIMAHPTRRRFVGELADRLPEAVVVWDRENDRWETGSRSLLSFDSAADAHLVIQDDSLPCRDLVAGAMAAFKATDGERPIALYTGRVRPHRETVTPAVKRALRIGSPWLEMPGPWWGPGLVIPSAHIPELVEWGDRHPKIRNYDRRIEAFYQEQGIDCWYTVPSLVEHRPVEENPSLVKGRTGNRQAHSFIGERSPLNIDWTLPPVRLDSAAVFRHRHAGRTRTVQAGSAQYRALSRNPNWIEEMPSADLSLAA